MSITDANDLNHVLEFLLGMPQPGFRGPDSDFAQAAACRLADRANKALSAGIDGVQVTKHWPRNRGRKGKPA